MIVPTCGDLSLLDWLFFSAKSPCLSNSSALHHAIFPPLENIPFMFIIVMWHISRHLQIFHSCFLLTSTTLNYHVTYFPPSTNISFMFTIDLNDLKLSCEIPFEVILTAPRLRLIVPLMFLQLCDLNLIVSQWNIVRKIFIKNMGLQVGTKSLSAQATMYRFLEGAKMNWNVRLTPQFISLPSKNPYIVALERTTYNVSVISSLFLSISTSLCAILLWKMCHTMFINMISS